MHERGSSARARSKEVQFTLAISTEADLTDQIQISDLPRIIWSIVSGVYIACSFSKAISSEKTLTRNGEKKERDKFKEGSVP